MNRALSVSAIALLVAVRPSLTAADVPVVQETKGEFGADALSFESRVEINANCKEVFSVLTEMKRIGALIPHIHGKAKV
ncbi:MAG: hypothetical protein ACREQQ_02365, partial [Candidatus Binatia bacterium]